MTLLGILFALLLERVVEKVRGWREHRWLADYYQWMQRKLGSSSFWSGPGGVMMVHVPLVVAVGLVFGVLNAVFFGFLSFIAGVGVLLMCLGPRDLDADTDAFLDAVVESDDSAMQARAEEILGKKPADLNDRVIIEGVFSESLERTFGVLFWFSILGPVGAVLFRVSSQMQIMAKKSDEEKEGFVKAARRLHSILLWLPARLLALGFAVVGNFEDALHNWRTCADEFEGDWVESGRQVVKAAGCGAMRLDTMPEDETAESARFDTGKIRSAMALVWRTLVVWVVVILIMTLAGLAG